MLPPLIRVARAILKRRQTLKLSQRRVAAALGCSQPYLAQVETGRRPVSRKIAERLESVFKVKPGSYTNVTFRRGRPALSPSARRALREIRRAQGAAPRAMPLLGVPQHARPDRVSGLDNPLWPIAIHLGEQAAQEVRNLEKLRPADDLFWRQLQTIRYDSWSEKRLHVKVALTGAELTGVDPKRLGCVLPSADGRTGRGSRRAYPAFVWQWGDVSLALFPQRCVGTAHTHRWPDNLLVAARRGRRITGVVEVDGEPYHRDLDAEQRRDQELDVPVLHLDAAELGQAGLLDKLRLWTRRLFE